MYYLSISILYKYSMYVEHIIYIICTLNIYVYWCNMYIIMSSIYIYIYIHMSMRIVDGCKNRFGGVTCMIICMKMDTQWRHAYLRFNCMVLYQHLCACTFMYMIYCTQMSASKRVMLLDRILRSLLQDGPPVISWLLKTMNTIVI